MNLLQMTLKSKMPKWQHAIKSFCHAIQIAINLNLWRMNMRGPKTIPI